VTSVFRRRKDRTGGYSWQDAQKNAPGAFVRAAGPTKRSAETDAIIAWIRGRGPVTSQEIHHALFAQDKWKLWTLGCTTSRLGTFCNQGWVKRHPGGMFEMIAEPPKPRS
jgi:hypothetical protein